MPEPISRSSVSQIASYGPPEEVSSQGPKAEAPVAKPQVPATSDLSASHAPVERTSVKPGSKDACIATHKEVASLVLGSVGAVAGGITGFAAGAGAAGLYAPGPTKPIAVPVAAVIGGLGSGMGLMQAGQKTGDMLGALTGGFVCKDVTNKP